MAVGRREWQPRNLWKRDCISDINCRESNYQGTSLLSWCNINFLTAKSSYSREFDEVKACGVVVGAEISTFTRIGWKKINILQFETPNSCDRIDGCLPFSMSPPNFLLHVQRDNLMGLLILCKEIYSTADICTFFLSQNHLFLVRLIKKPHRALIFGWFVRISRMRGYRADVGRGMHVKVRH